MSRPEDLAAALDAQGLRQQSSLQRWLRSVRKPVVLLLLDLLALSAAFAIAIMIRHWMGGFTGLPLYVRALPFVPVFFIGYWFLRLYSGVASNPADELRRLSLGTAGGFLAFGTLAFLGGQAEVYSRLVLLLALILALILVPLVRAGGRWLMARVGWWGEPVIVIGGGRTGAMVIQDLLRKPWLGFRPVAVLDDHIAVGERVADIPVVGDLDDAAALARDMGFRHAILAMPGGPMQRLQELERSAGEHYAHIYIIPPLVGFASLWVEARELGRALGLEVKRRLVMPGPRMVKAVQDYLLALLLLPCFIIAFILIAIAIKIDSRGPVIYRQERLGVNGRRFQAFKFRSMYGDGEQRLQELLDADPARREEYERSHKLADDPRVTRIGRFLRRSSLDELPQILNVLRGEMSLVGPRAYLPREEPDMQGMGELIRRVRPGITGYWQVNGRASTSFAERLDLDAYYVHNWSPWLDIYILARTVAVVLGGKGAY